LEQANKLGIKAKILSADGFSNPEIFDLAKDYADGVIFSNSADESKMAGDLRKAFEEKYNDRWKEKPDSFSLNSYDSANILIRAIEKVYTESGADDQNKLNLDRDKIRDYVSATSNYDGVSGKITFLASGDAIKNVGIFKADAKNKKYDQIAVYKIDENGKLVEIK